MFAGKHKPIQLARPCSRAPENRDIGINIQYCERDNLNSLVNSIPQEQVA